MTWQEYYEECAERLAACHDTGEFHALLQEIDALVSKQPPPGGVRTFWDEVLKRYRRQPTPLLKEAAAAAALNALLTVADTILARRAGKK